MSARPGHHSLDTATRPLVLIWELTQACALACDHCRADAQPDRHPAELSTAEGRELLEQAREFGEGQLVVLSGGDPLVRDDVDELIAYGTELGLGMTITPSGTRSLTRKRIESLADAGLRRMALSLDGATAASHDAFRGEEGSYEETLQAVEDATSAGIPVQINTTVCRETVGELPEIRTLLSELGVVMWSVFFLVPIGRGRVLEPIDPVEADAVMTWLHEVSQSEPYGLKTTEAPQYRRVASERGRATGPLETEEKSLKTNGRSDSGEDAGTRRPNGTRSTNGVSNTNGIIAGDGFAFVSHTGDVYPSGFLPSSAGNVRDRSITDLYRNSSLFESLRDRDGLTGKCGACPYRSLCGGSRSRAYAYFEDPLASDPLCPFVPDGYDGPLPWDELGESLLAPHKTTTAD